MDYGHNVSYHWITITFVCSHWRRVAIETSALWKHIVLHKFGYMNTLLERSRKAPLSIICWHNLLRTRNPTPQHPAIDQLGPHLPRVERAHIIFDSEYPTPTSIYTLLSSYCAPTLRCISLKNIYWSPSPEPGAELDDWVKQDQYSPRSLCFEMIHHNTVKLMVGSHLRHLYMNNVTWHNVEMFLSILKKTPELESLICVGSIRRAPNTPYSMVALPRLRLLRIYLGTIPVLSTFLQHLTYPAIVTVDLKAVVMIPSLRSSRYLEELDINMSLKHLFPKDLSALTVTPDVTNVVFESTNFTLRIDCPYDKHGRLISRLSSCEVNGALQSLTLGPSIDSYEVHKWSAGTYEGIQTGACNVQYLSVPSTYYLRQLLFPSIRHRMNTASVGPIPLHKLKKLYIGKRRNEDLQILCNILEARMKQGYVLDEIYVPYEDNHSVYKSLAQLVRKVYMRS